MGTGDLLNAMQMSLVCPQTEHAVNPHSVSPKNFRTDVFEDFFKYNELLLISAVNLTVKAFIVKIYEHIGWVVGMRAHTT